MVLDASGKIQHVHFAERVADLHALCFQEGERHAATDNDLVDFLAEIFNDSDFPGHFGSTQNGGKWAHGIGDGSLKVLDLFLKQLSCCGIFNVFCNADGLAVGAERGSKRVVDKHISQRG